MKKYRFIGNSSEYDYIIKKGEIFNENEIPKDWGISIKEEIKDYPENWEEVKEETTLGVKDNINPNHYKNGKVECIDALESATVNKKGLEAVCTANVIKYLWRYESKNGLEDVKKAKWYIERLIKVLEDE